MLSKANRLPSSGVENTKQKGRSISSSSFSVKYLDNGDSDNPRFAFVISKKIDKKAVVRNKIKRLLKAAVFREIKKAKKGRGHIFFVKKDILLKSPMEIEEEVSNAFENI